MSDDYLEHEILRSSCIRSGLRFVSVETGNLKARKTSARNLHERNYVQSILLKHKWKRMSNRSIFVELDASRSMYFREKISIGTCKYSELHFVANQQTNNFPTESKDQRAFFLLIHFYFNVKIIRIQSLIIYYLHFYLRMEE